MRYSPVTGHRLPPAYSHDHRNIRCNILQQNLAPQYAQHAGYKSIEPAQRLGQRLGEGLQLTDILEQGAYGVVYSAVQVKTGEQFAVKCLSKINSKGLPVTNRQIADFWREVRLHYLASAHRNVVSLLQVIDSPDSLNLVLEYCPEGDLFQNITDRSLYVGNDQLVKKVFLQILDAVEHCQSLGIFHRDLKPENFLVADQGETVKLTDFGLATCEVQCEHGGCGSTLYMSPECLHSPKWTSHYLCGPSDVWSLGVILINLTCGRNPWEQATLQDPAYRAYCQNGEWLVSALDVSHALNDILRQVFVPVPQNRLTLRELRVSVMRCFRFHRDIYNRDSDSFATVAAGGLK